MDRLTDGVDLFVAVARVTIEEKIRYPAAALAYYAFVSFVPLLLLAFAVIGRRLAVELAQTSPQFLTPPVRELVNRSIATATGRTGASLLAVVVLGWSGANFVGDVRTVVNQVEGNSGGTLRDWVRDGAVIFGSIGTAILAVAATSVVFTLPPAGPLVGFAGFVGLWLALTVAFVPLYYVPSQVVTSPQWALPGAITASFGWALLHAAFHFYATNAGQYAVYGVLSGVIVLLTGLYLAASLLLIGIVVNAQVAERSEHRDAVDRDE